MMCRMCLQKSPEVLDIFADEKTEYNIPATIAQHFWFQPTNDDMISTIICVTCWRRIESFHVYYLCVEEAQRKLASRFAVEHEQTSLHQQPTNAKVKEFINIQQEGTNGVHDPVTEYEWAKEMIVLDEEKILEQNCYFGADNKANVYGCCAQKGKLEGSKSDGFDEELIEEVALNLWEEIPDQKEQSTFIKIESVDSDSQENTEIVDLDDSDDDPLISYQHRQKYICNTSCTTNRQARSSKFSLKTKEDLKIARTVQLKCDLCGAGFTTFAEVARHIKTIHGLKGYVKCCNRKWFERGAILDHANKHLDSNFFKCPKCNKALSDKRCLKNHLLRHELKNARIPPCANVPKHANKGYFMGQGNYKGTPAEEHHGNYARAKLYQCDKCPRRFAKVSVLNQHIMGHTSKVSCFSCDMCMKSFPSEALFETHQKSVHHPKMCPICGKVIEGETLFAEHQQLEHSDRVDEKIQCEKCGMWLKNPLRLMAHTKKVHSDGKPIKSEHICHICGKLSISEIGLKGHIRFVHAVKRRFVCNVCGKGFKTGISLKEHMACHTGDVLYTCPHCPKTFKSSGNMYSHLKKMHTQEWEERRRIRSLSRNVQSKDRNTS